MSDLDDNDMEIISKSDMNREVSPQLDEQLITDIIKKDAYGKNTDLTLRPDKDGLTLAGNSQSLRGDFTRMRSRINPGNLNRELLIKASKIKGKAEGLTAVDATAGLGEDAFLLAAAGFSVRLYERDPVIAALLHDALSRAAAIPDLAAIVGRMELFETDSLTALPQLGFNPDVVLLDPMFPARQKSALIKKKFQLLQQLEQPCTDEDALLHAAIASAPYKIVIKRPLKGAWLADRKPDYSLKGQTIRYDCIVLTNSGREGGLVECTKQTQRMAER